MAEREIQDSRLRTTQATSRPRRRSAAMADDTGTQYAGLTPDERTLARVHPHMATCDAPAIDDCPPCRVVLARIRRDLAALAADGRLLPAGGETREEWTVAARYPTGERFVAAVNGQDRCPNCDHRTSIHHDEGCRYTAARGRSDANLVCPCDRQGTWAPDPAELLAHARTIWGDHHDDLPTIAVALTVVTGDIARGARAAQEGRPDAIGHVGKELGNLILSAVRWCDDLGLDPAECVARGAEAQRAYVARRATESAPGGSDVRSQAGQVVVPVAALRRLNAVYDAWHNRIGTLDPGRELVSEGVTLTGIASLLDIEDSRLMEQVCDALEPHLPAIEAALAQSPQGHGDASATPAAAPDEERAAAATLGPSDEARSGGGD